MLIFRTKYNFKHMQNFDLGTRTSYCIFSVLKVTQLSQSIILLLFCNIINNIIKHHIEWEGDHPRFCGEVNCRTEKSYTKFSHNLIITCSQHPISQLEAP